MIYFIEFWVPYEGTETYFILEHDETYSDEELDKIVTKAIKEFTKIEYDNEYSDIDRMELEDMYVSSYHFDEYLCENYGFRKATYKIWSMDSLTKYGDLK